MFQSLYSGRGFSVTLLALLTSLLDGSVTTADEQARIDFNQDVIPILSDKCYACHGQDEEHRAAELRLDNFTDATADRDGAAAIVPGKPEASLVWERIRTDDPSLIMPPEDSHKKLTATQKEVIRQWIEQGAVYREHWAYVAPEKAEVPASEFSHPIDAFLEKSRRERKLPHNGRADKRTLIRRITLDLTGLPPTMEEVRAFVADEQPDAYERLVDRLLARHTYGENMARSWLDLARYADTHGLHLDNIRSMWPYRDWVVQAFNENQPFDEFTRWQLAGDLLPDSTREQQIASGFNRCNVSTSEGGSINEEWIYRYAVDRTSTMAEVWMGMTAGCAVCHDHKFDPLSTHEYYSLYAFFHSAADPAMDGNKQDTPPVLKLYSEEEKAKIASLQMSFDEIEQQLQQAVSSYAYSDPATLEPPPQPEETETVWFEDAFPAGVNVQSTGAPLKLITASEGPVLSGEISLQRTAGGLEQDFFSGGAEFVLPSEGKIFAHCYLDPENLPAAIMIQFHTDGWKHRAVWGEEEKIPFGKSDSTEKVLMGALPEAGAWVRLEVPADKMGLMPGQKVIGYAFTQSGGTVTWDRMGVVSRIDRANDPAWSFEIWKKQNQGKRNNDLPEGLRQLVRGKQPDAWSADEARQVFEFWVENFYAGISDEITVLKSQKTKLKSQIEKVENDVPLTLVMADLQQPRESFVMIRGAYDKPGEKVSRNVPAFLPPLPEKEQGDYDRLDLANWLVSQSHPLTARVTVNRLWQQLFGIGIVKTSGDFGLQGEPPVHSALLDWLAVDFVENGWDVKRLIKLIVMSEAYRQDSQVMPVVLERDPENRYLARGPRLRLPAEVLRDQALFHSGLLVEKMGGAGVFPYQPPNIWEPVAFGGSNTRYYKQSSGEGLYRRSLYTFLKRTAPPPFMSTFDAPSREQSCTSRERTNTPLQALQLMNDVQYFEAARAFAERMLSEGGETPETRLAWGWEVTTSRPPTPHELKLLADLLQDYRDRYQQDAVAAKKVITYGESPPSEKFAPSELAAYTLIGNLLLNLDETINKN